MKFKQIIALVYLICAVTASYSQTIKGIGDLVIGMSVEEFLELPEIKIKNIKDFQNASEINNWMDLRKTTIDSSVSDIDYRVYSADVVKFDFLYQVGIFDRQGDDKYKLTATFYKTKLARLYISDFKAEFEDILTKKYGKPIKLDKLTSISCQNAYGAVSTQIKGSETLIWGKDKKIVATLRSNYPTCNYYSMSYGVEESAIARIMDRIEENGRTAAKIKEEKTKIDASKI